VLCKAGGFTRASPLWNEEGQHVDAGIDTTILFTVTNDPTSSTRTRDPPNEKMRYCSGGTDGGLFGNPQSANLIYIKLF
jgi:hypothetical protein